MKKKFLFVALTTSLLFVACDYNKDNFEGLDYASQITDVKKVEYTLTKADYTAIADNKANKSLAKTLETEFPGITTALANVKTKNYMTELASSEKFFPNFIAEKWYTGDKGSAVKLTYDKLIDAPAYLAQVEGAEAYKLKDADYSMAWDDKSYSYFTPAKPASTFVPRILKNTQPDAQAGDYVRVEYNFSSNEPSGDGGEVDPYTKIVDIISGADGEYTAKGSVLATYSRGFLLGDGTGSILVYQYDMPNVSLGDVVEVKGTTSKYSGLKQFSNTPAPEVTKLEVAESFEYPAFESMDGAALDTYLNTPTLKAASYTGKLILDGNYYNITEIEGAASAIGTFSYPVAGIVDPELVGQKVTVNGYLIGSNVSRNLVNTMVVNIAAAGTTPTTKSIGEVALAPVGKYNVRGQVVATYGQGFLMNDGTGSILVFQKAAPSNKIGDIVSVSGDISVYNGLNQFKENASVTKINKEDVSVTYPKPFEMLGEDVTAYASALCVRYVTYKGELIIGTSGSGNKIYNIKIDGTDLQGAISYPQTGLIDESLEGQEVIVTGYTIGAFNKNFYTIATSVVASTPANRAKYATRASLTEKMYAIYQFDGSDWNIADDIAVVNPSDYEQMGISTNSFSSSYNPDNYLPQFMGLKFPYAHEGDAKAAVYFYNTSTGTTTSAVEYVLTNGVWTKNTNIVTVTDQFVFDGEKWKFDPSVTIRLTKGDADSKAFLKHVVEWVKENKTDRVWVDSYGTAEFYFGCSSYYGNVEMSPNYLKPYYPDMSDEEMVAEVKKHIAEGAFTSALEATYPDADLVADVDVYYTVTFDVHKAEGAGVYTMKYIVTGKGQFEAVPNSLEEVE